MGAHVLRESLHLCVVLEGLLSPARAASPNSVGRCSVRATAARTRRCGRPALTTSHWAASTAVSDEGDGPFHGKSRLGLGRQGSLMPILGGAGKP